MKRLMIVTCIVAVTGCASKPESIAPLYVSPELYQTYSCEQLASEGSAVSVEAQRVAEMQQKIRHDDQIKTTIGVVLFWPVLFLNEGNGQNAAYLAQLKGKMDALRQASVARNCGIQFVQ